MESWIEIVGFEGLYAISSHGRVKSIKRRLIKKQSIKWEYYSINLWRNGNTWCKRVHRLVAEAFKPNPENKPQVNHKDGNKLNNRASNLEWATRSENTVHSFKNGLQKKAKGELNAMAKIKESDVLEIRRLRKEGNKLKEISVLYGISFKTVSKIINHQRWSHI